MALSRAADRPSDGYTAPSAQRSRIMAAVKRKDTKPELQLRRALHAAGYRYRKDFPIKVGGRVVRPDIVFTRSRVAVFVDGCFWHCCTEHRQIPSTNNRYWASKLAANVARDRQQDSLLSSAGWLVIRIWEHEPLDVATALVVSAVTSCHPSRL